MNEGEDMNSTAVKTGEAFWKALLEHIVEKGRRTPKSQVERAIGPILGFFLDQAISDLLNTKVITLAAEFPLKKKGSNLSTNVDWLMYDTVNNELLLVELKTDMESFCRNQLARYLEFIDSDAPWKELMDGFNEILLASKSWKYVCVNEELLDKTETSKNIKDATAKLLYLMPKRMVEKSRDLADKERVILVPFEALRMPNDGKYGVDFAPYQEMLYQTLRRLDDYCEESLKGPRGSSAYQEKLSLKDVLVKCGETNAERPIIVGFMGGEGKLKQQSLAHLEQRSFKGDWGGDNGASGKDRRNWVRADAFIDIVKSLPPEHSRSDEEIRYLVEQISDALRNNRKLTLGQILDGLSSTAGVPLEDMSDDALVRALATKK